MWGRSTKQRRAALERRRVQRALAFVQGRTEVTGLELVASRIAPRILVRHGWRMAINRDAMFLGDT